MTFYSSRSRTFVLNFHANWQRVQLLKLCERLRLADSGFEHSPGAEGERGLLKACEF